MQRIKHITLRNFKFFHGTELDFTQNQISLESNNLLLYGENGSGKSSIYWAIYTFLQSCLKTDDGEIFKYFRHTEAENLRNRLADDTAESGIVIHFQDEHKVPEIREITDTNINTKQGTFVRKTLDSSDFVNYKYLSKIYDFRNSEPIDLFPLFERDLLMFIDFGEEFTLNDGTLSGKTNADDWWKYIETSHTALPKRKYKVLVNTPEYHRYRRNLIPKFILNIREYLLGITEDTNKYLQERFNEDFKIDFDVENVKCDFNKKIGPRSKDGLLHRPKIPLKVNLTNSNIPEAKRHVANPHTFLNEAKLTALALAIRLAMLDDKPSFDDSGSLLVLDDLLVSLDMSNRDIVLDIILDKAAEYQLIILTHDKLFFQMAKHKIKTKGQTNWEYLEMYAYEKDNIPQPLIHQSESYLGKAIKYHSKKEYEIAGSFLRKEAEELCKHFLPKKLKSDEFGRLHNLSLMISRSIEFCQANGIDDTHFQTLNSHRQFVLNPSSHDSYNVPKFNNEVTKCIKTVEELKKIEVRDKVLEDETFLQFVLNSPAPNPAEWRFRIWIHDDFRIVLVQGAEPVLTKGMVNFIIYKDGQAVEKDSKELRDEHTSLKTMYEGCFEKSDKSSPSSFWDGITFVRDGSSLRSIL